jgi:hypothetical protein
MGLRGDYLVLKVLHTSVEQVIAEATSVSIDLSGDALDTTSQTDGLHASFIGGKVSCTVSGDYLFSSTAANFTNLFTHMNAGTLVEVTVYSGASPSAILEGDGVITSLGGAGGTSADLVTGSYSIQCSGNMSA